MTLRESVYRLYDGHCVMCRRQHRATAGPWEWQVHHCVPKQRLKRDGTLSMELEVCVVLCKRCHERHETATERVPWHKLPLRVRDAAVLLGPAVEDALVRYHPMEAMA